MKTFFILKSSKRKVDAQEVKNDLSLVLFPEDIEPEHLAGSKYGVAIEAEHPQCEEWQYCEETFEKDPNGYWRQIWTVKEKGEQVKNEIMMRRYDQAFTWHLDSMARTHGYDSHYTMLGYKDSANARFRSEGQAMHDYRDKVWLTAQEWLLDHTTEPQDDIPSPEDLVSQLPPFVVEYGDE